MRAAYRFKVRANEIEVGQLFLHGSANRELRVDVYNKGRRVGQLAPL